MRSGRTIMCNAKAITRQGRTTMYNAKAITRQGRTIMYNAKATVRQGRIITAGKATLRHAKVLQAMEVEAPEGAAGLVAVAVEEGAAKIKRKEKGNSI